MLVAGQTPALPGSGIETHTAMDKLTPHGKITGSYEIKQNISKMICSSCAREFPISDGISRCPHDNALLAPVLEDPFIGQILAEKYEVVELLGVGGFAQVYKAYHIALDRIVAIKILGSHLISHMDAIKRFEHEAKIVSQLIHPNIISVHDYGLVPQPYLVMEFLEGVTLDKLIGGKPVPLDLASGVLCQLCDALQFAHDQGVVHRDLKPSNVMLMKDTSDNIVAKILDFGVAKLTTDAMLELSGLTRSGETVGSPAYMSPEQCQGRQPDRRSDIYSLGCLIYETLSGEHPYIGRNSVELMHKHLMQAVPELLQKHPELKVPKAFEYVISAAMAKDPDDRYQTMAEVKEDIKAAISCKPEEFKRRTQARKRERQKALKRFAFISSIVMVIGIIAASLLWYLQIPLTTLQAKQATASENNPELLKKLNLADQLLSDGLIAQAINMSKETTQLFPNSESAYKQLALVQLQNAFSPKSTSLSLARNQPFLEVVESASKAIELNDKDPVPYEIRIRAYCWMQKIPDATRDFMKLEKMLAPNDPMTPIMRALIQSSTGETDKAGDNLELAEKMHPDAAATSLIQNIRQSMSSSSNKTKVKPH